MLRQLRHPNIISLIGFCLDKKERILVYENMSNRSLQQRQQTLSWKKRLDICIGAALGLHYLHAGLKRTIIHRYIRPGNILLDDNMIPRLSEFRFCVLGAHFMSKPKPIQVEGPIVVQEKRFSTRYEGQINVEENIDENIKGKIAPQCWQVFMDITQRCIKIEPDERPTMSEVEVELEHALSLQEQVDISNTDGHYILLSETIVDRRFVA
ncbi:hypothetical protein Fmac_011080 [Flemingia macrophylla]|uniref:Protein kinase domain-containing protein n=1 Tax=Flemingia macrophylla TaxID=520843 RepID=A0ABD1MLI7_9FABA